MESPLRATHRAFAKSSLAMMAVVYDDVVKCNGVPKNGDELLAMMSREIFQDEEAPMTPEKPKKESIVAPNAPRKRSPSTSSDDMSVEKSRGRPKKVLSAEEQAAKDAKAAEKVAKKEASESKKRMKMEAVVSELRSLSAQNNIVLDEEAICSATKVGDLNMIMKNLKKDISAKKKAEKAAKKAEESDDESSKKSRGRPKKVLSAEEQAVKDAKAAEKAAKKAEREQKKADKAAKKAEESDDESSKKSRGRPKKVLSAEEQAVKDAKAAEKAAKKAEREQKKADKAAKKAEREQKKAAKAEKVEKNELVVAEAQPSNVFVSVVKKEEEIADDVSSISSNDTDGEVEVESSEYPELSKRSDITPEPSHINSSGNFMFMKYSGETDILEFNSMFKEISTGKYFGTDDDGSVYSIEMVPENDTLMFPDQITMDNIELVGDWDHSSRTIVYHGED